MSLQILDKLPLKDWISYLGSHLIYIYSDSHFHPNYSHQKEGVSCESEASVEEKVDGLGASLVKKKGETTKDAKFVGSNKNGIGDLIGEFGQYLLEGAQIGFYNGRQSYYVLAEDPIQDLLSASVPNDTKRAMIGYIILFGILLLIVLGYFPEPAHEIHFRLQTLAAVSI